MMEIFMLLTLDYSKLVSGKFKMGSLGTHEKGQDHQEKRRWVMFCRPIPFLVGPESLTDFSAAVRWLVMDLLFSILPKLLEPGERVARG